MLPDFEQVATPGLDPEMLVLPLVLTGQVTGEDVAKRHRWSCPSGISANKKLPVKLANYGGNHRGTARGRR